MKRDHKAVLAVSRAFWSEGSPSVAVTPLMALMCRLGFPTPIIQ